MTDCARQAVEIAARCFETELRAWIGREPLHKIFWLYGVVASCVFATIFAVAVSEGQIIAQEGLLLVFAPYTAWLLVSVWRCADASRSPWREVARILTVPWAANVALLVFFLQLEILLSIAHG